MRPVSSRALETRSDVLRHTTESNDHALAGPLRIHAHRADGRDRRDGHRHGHGGAVDREIRRQPPVRGRPQHPHGGHAAGAFAGQFPAQGLRAPPIDLGLLARPPLPRQHRAVADHAERRVVSPPWTPRRSIAWGLSGACHHRPPPGDRGPASSGRPRAGR